MPTVPISILKNVPLDQQPSQAAVNAAAASSVAATMAAGSPSGPKLKQVAPNKSLQQRMKEQQKLNNQKVQSERHEVVTKQKNAAVLAAAAIAAKKSTTVSEPPPAVIMPQKQRQKQRRFSSNYPIRNSTGTIQPPSMKQTQSANGSATAALLAFNKVRPSTTPAASLPSITAATAATAASIVTSPPVSDPVAVESGDEHNYSPDHGPPRPSSPSYSISSMRSNKSHLITAASKLKAEELGRSSHQRSKSSDPSGSEHSLPSFHSEQSSGASPTLYSLAATATVAAKLAGATNKPLSVTALPPVKDDNGITTNSFSSSSGSALAAAMAARTTVVDTFEKINNDVNMKMDKQQKHTKRKRRIYQPAARWTRSSHPVVIHTVADITYAPAPVRPSAQILGSTNWIENIPDSSSVRSSSPDRGRSRSNQSPDGSLRTSQSRPRSYLQEMSLSETLLVPHPWEKELRNASTDSLTNINPVTTKDFSSSPSGSPRLPLPSPRGISRDSSKSPSNFDYFTYKNVSNSIGTVYNASSPLDIPQSHSAPTTSAQNSTTSLSSTLRHANTTTYTGLARSKSPTKQSSFFNRFSLKNRNEQVVPPPTTLKSTMRKEHKHRNFNEDKPWKHHMDAFFLTDREKKRYEGLWATNKGIHLKYLYEEEDDEQDPEHESEEYHDENYDNNYSSLDMHNPTDDIHGLIVKDIWGRSRLPDYILAQIWDLVDRHHDGTLDREGFLVGMWLVDQCLYGRKLPNKIDDKVWSSVGRLNVRIRLHKKERKKDNKKERKKKE